MFAGEVAGRLHRDQWKIHYAMEGILTPSIDKRTDSRLPSGSTSLQSLPSRVGLPDPERRALVTRT